MLLHHLYHLLIIFYSSEKKNEKRVFIKQRIFDEIPTIDVSDTITLFLFVIHTVIAQFSNITGQKREGNPLISYCFVEMRKSLSPKKAFVAKFYFK